MASSPHVSPASVAPMRLTTRGRRVVVVSASVLILLVMNAVDPLSARAQDGRPAAVSIVVSPGQTLWDIALAVAPQADPRSTIFDIQQLNHMATADLAEGQVLLVPVAN